MSTFWKRRVFITWYLQAIINISKILPETGSGLYFSLSLFLHFRNWKGYVQSSEMVTVHYKLYVECNERGVFQRMEYVTRRLQKRLGMWYLTKPKSSLKQDYISNSGTCLPM